MRVGPFTLHGRLGEGGFGVVYLGTSRAGVKVAVKVIHRWIASDPKFRKAFSDEVAAARRVSGVYTAPLVDADPDASPPWLATGYLAGQSLKDRVNQGGPLSFAEVVRLGAMLAEGLAAIHAAGLAHRDFTPGNVILADDNPRVIDFGLARDADATVRMSDKGKFVGTPPFMSPEQVKGDFVGPASDVFSFGSVLTFAATGRGPFWPDAMSCIYRIIALPPDLGRVPAGPLRDVIGDCLEKEPAYRPSLDGVITRLTAITVPSHSGPSAPAPAGRAAPGLAPLSLDLAVIGRLAPGPVSASSSLWFTQGAAGPQGSQEPAGSLPGFTPVPQAETAARGEHAGPGHSLFSGEPRRIGPYTIIERLSENRTGSVFLGESPGGGRVAVKILREDAARDPQLRASLRREADLLRRISSPYVAPLVAADPDGSPPWLATAYVPGPSLKKVVDERGPLPVAEVRALGGGLASGLSAIHAAGLVHRNLKPPDIALTDGGPRITDFGLALDVSPSVALTRSGLVAGTPLYMSPEQVRADRTGPESDIFSLGSVLTFAATGHAPFPSSSDSPWILFQRIAEGTLT